MATRHVEPTSIQVVMVVCEQTRTDKEVKAGLNVQQNETDTATGSIHDAIFCQIEADLVTQDIQQCNSHENSL